MAVVDLSADLAACRNGHDSELEILTGPQGVAESLVVERGLLDVDDVRVRAVVVALLCSHCGLLAVGILHLRAYAEFWWPVPS